MTGYYLGGRLLCPECYHAVGSPAPYRERVHHTYSCGPYEAEVCDLCSEYLIVKYRPLEECRECSTNVRDEILEVPDATNDTPAAA